MLYQYDNGGEKLKEDMSPPLTEWPGVMAEGLLTNLSLFTRWHRGQGSGGTEGNRGVSKESKIRLWCRKA